MIVAVGLDIVDVSRIIDLLDRHDRRFVARLLGPEEIALYKRRPDPEVFLAGRFAAKEAVIKSLAGILEKRPSFTSLQILPSDTGQPTVVPAESIRNTLASYRWLLSLSHERNMAAAVAILLKK